MESGDEMTCRLICNKASPAPVPGAILPQLYFYRAKFQRKVTG